MSSTDRKSSSRRHQKDHSGGAWESRLGLRSMACETSPGRVAVFTIYAEVGDESRWVRIEAGPGGRGADGVLSLRSPRDHDGDYARGVSAEKVAEASGASLAFARGVVSALNQI